MPEKITSYNLPILIPESDFEKIEQAINLEGSLKRLMEHANQSYDMVYRNHKDNPDIKKFNFCKQNFRRIKSIIELKGKSLLNTPLYLEARISMLYSKVHALNLEPETKDELNKLIKKIQTVETSFKQLLTIIPCLDLSNENPARLLKYIDAFEQTWKTKEKRLLADIHFNFAETLVEQSNFQLALDHFEKAINLYEEAANAADNTNENKMLLKFSQQTKDRLKIIKSKIKTQPLEDYSNKLCKELRIQLQKLPDSPSKWTIVNTSPSAQSVEENQTIEIKNFIEKKAYHQK
ncbi:MAG TPA: tetratricopeptide repeat protein [Candidatus Aquirickettsiella sp.]|jgi:tetratricopeptide (TPR) repeat protein